MIWFCGTQTPPFSVVLKMECTYGEYRRIAGILARVSEYNWAVRRRGDDRQLSKEGRRRWVFTLPRCFFWSTRRRLEDAVGLVARRSLGT